jgi:hypothetical protein
VARWPEQVEPRERKAQQRDSNLTIYHEGVLMVG